MYVFGLYTLLNNNENDSLRSDNIVRLHVLRKVYRVGWLDSASAMTSPVRVMLAVNMVGFVVSLRCRRKRKRRRDAGLQ